MRRIKKKLQSYTKVVMCLTLSIVISFSCVCISFASVRIKGFGVYRQGNAPNPSGHAGLVYAQNISVNEPIIHVAQEAGQLVHRAGLTTFQDDQDFYGYYVPKTFKDLSATEKVTKMDSVVAIADDFLGLSTDVLSYNLIYQIWYSVDLNGNGKVDPAEITSMRCDGLVEYAYEYNGFSVYGGNISIFNTDIRNDHGAPNVTPKQQIKHHLQNCLGDIDGDGNVSSADSRLASRYAADLEEFDVYQQWNADVDGDEDIDYEDARLILRYSSGLETGFEADPFPS